MKKSIIFFIGLSMSISILLSSCQKKQNPLTEMVEEIPITSLDQLDYYTESDIQYLEQTLRNQSSGFGAELDFDAFQQLSFQPPVSGTNQEYLKAYFSELMYLNDSKRIGEQANYDLFLDEIVNDPMIDEAGKIYLLSALQISVQFLVSENTLALLDKVKNEEYRNYPCCQSLYDYHVAYRYYCQLGYGYYCSIANQYLQQYNTCVVKGFSCPPGFTFDSRNCYSGKSYPSGYTGFIYDRKFYTKQNCGKSTSNNCCPSGSSFDSKNCYFGISYPSGYTGFIYDRKFYVKVRCN